MLAGLGVVGVPLLSLIMPAREAAGVMLPVLLAMDCFAVYAYRRAVNRRILAIMLPGAAIGTLVAWAVWSIVPEAAVRLLVGLITFAFVLDAILPIRRKLTNPDPSAGWGRFWAACSGFTSFVSHAGGPPFQIYVLPQRLSPLEFSGTSAFFFAGLNTMKLIPYFFLGQLSTENLTLSAALAPVGAAGVVIGVLLMRRISARLFYTIAYGLVLVLSCKLIWDGATALLGL